jgi:membrane protease YdiL (CAAX protease family)
LCAGLNILEKMNIFCEKVGFSERKDSSILFVVILSTFLLLFLYHHDSWRPIRYWLFLNGLILFIVPLLSLIFLGEKRNIFLRILSGFLILFILLFLLKVSTTRQLFSIIKRVNVLYPLAAFFIISTIVILIAGKANLTNYGIKWGKVKFWVPIIVVFLLFMIPLIFWASGLQSFQKTYPMLPLAKKGVVGFIVAELSFGIFFIFWEFFFRGYMLFSLSKRVGFLIANCLQAIAFAFMHIGKPELEVYSALAGGLIIGWLCYRSKSFLPAFFIHWGIQTIMDLFAVLG